MDAKRSASHPHVRLCVRLRGAAGALRRRLGLRRPRLGRPQILFQPPRLLVRLSRPRLQTGGGQTGRRHATCAGRRGASRRARCAATWHASVAWVWSQALGRQARVHNVA